jgi:hypothetical protein
MTKRLLTAVFLMLALLSASSGTPLQRCGMMMPETTASSCGCCAMMKSCVTTQQVPAQSAATVGTTQEFTAIIAPVLHELVTAAFAPSSRAREISVAQSPVHSTARLALLCTFLI